MNQDDYIQLTDAMAKIAMTTEELFHISIPSQAVIHILTVRDLISYI